jgi:hypothetical protein
MAPKTLVLSAALLPLLLAGRSGAGELDPGGVVLEDVLEVQVLGRELHAVRAEGSGRLVTRLEIGEDVRWTGARGRVGVVITDRRLLGATPDSSQWQEERLRVDETPPAAALVGGRAALVVTRTRALALGGRALSWVEVPIGPNEEVRARDVGQGTALVVTDRRALGFSADAGGFFETSLRLGEALEGASAGSTVATVTTSQRVLTFRAPSGSWGSRSRPLD